MVCCDVRRVSRGRACVCYYVIVVGSKIDQLVDFYRLTMGPLH